MTEQNTVFLEDMDEWAAFVAANQDAITSAYGTVENALKVCCDGGLILGGGAQPAFLVVFRED